MTKSNIHNADTYHFCSTDKILLDANIWLYLFPPPCDPKHYWGAKYGAVFKKLQAAKADIIIDQFLISEFLNRYSRIEFGVVKAKYGNNYKRFRASKDFSSVAISAVGYAKKIISLTIHHGNAIDVPMIVDAISDFGKAKIDFNDSIFVQLCQKNNYKFLTNDVDFYDSPVEIITCNPNLLC